MLSMVFAAVRCDRQFWSCCKSMLWSLFYFYKCVFLIILSLKWKLKSINHLVLIAATRSKIPAGCCSRQFIEAWWHHMTTSICVNFGSVNSSPPSSAYMRRWNVSALFQVMACRPCGTKPLHEPTLDYNIGHGVENTREAREDLLREHTSIHCDEPEMEVIM